jgi:energy-converting hydrogenase Eha subunit E
MKKYDILQWIGAVFIIVGHITNAIGPSVYPLNIVAFTIGTIFFMAWTIMVRNKPQLIVNVVSIFACLFGLFNAWSII